MHFIFTTHPMANIWQVFFPRSFVYIKPTANCKSQQNKRIKKYWPALCIPTNKRKTNMMFSNKRKLLNYELLTLEDIYILWWACMWAPQSTDLGQWITINSNVGTFIETTIGAKIHGDAHLAFPKYCWLNHRNTWACF